MPRLADAVSSSGNSTSSSFADLSQPSPSINAVSDFTAKCCFASVESFSYTSLMLSSSSSLMFECHLCRSNPALLNIALIAVLKAEHDSVSSSPEITSSM